MKSKIVGLLLLLWGGAAIVGAAVAIWNPNGQQAARAASALLAGAMLMWSGFRCMRPAKIDVPPLSIDEFKGSNSVEVPLPPPPLSARNFPGWAAPLIGTAIGAAIGLRLAFENGQGHLDFFAGMLLATGLGFGGGCVVWLLESLRNRASRRAADLAIPADQKPIRPQ